MQQQQQCALHFARKRCDAVKEDLLCPNGVPRIDFPHASSMHPATQELAEVEHPRVKGEGKASKKWSGTGWVKGVGREGGGGSCAAHAVDLSLQSLEVTRRTKENLLLTTFCTAQAVMSRGCARRLESGGGRDSASKWAPMGLWLTHLIH